MGVPAVNYAERADSLRGRDQEFGVELLPASRGFVVSSRSDSGAVLARGYRLLVEKLVLSAPHLSCLKIRSFQAYFPSRKMSTDKGAYPRPGPWGIFT